MTEWWQTAYRGGPMVPLPGFPRPLYPPDHPTPSPPGPDVEGYKRTVWRAGRWQGPASRFDRAYSAAFAHGEPGTGGDVGSSGIAGVQRQQGILATGYIGEPTFNTLRSLRVPDAPGFEHAGEMAMDALAQNLIAEAFALFNRKPPAPTVRERALAGAAKWLGTTEDPPGSNSTPFGRWYGVDYQPWCAIFASYCFEVEAGGSPSFAAGSSYAYVPYIVHDARAGWNGLTATEHPEPGDLACYDWTYDGTFDHVGIFEAGEPSSFQAIEGNTSAASDSNGGQVQRRYRSNIDTEIVFVRVAEA